jgi:hypothetical protein
VVVRASRKQIYFRQISVEFPLNFSLPAPRPARRHKLEWSCVHRASKSIFVEFPSNFRRISVEFQPASASPGAQTQARLAHQSCVTDAFVCDKSISVEF